VERFVQGWHRGHLYGWGYRCVGHDPIVGEFGHLIALIGRWRPLAWRTRAMPRCSTMDLEATDGVGLCGRGQSANHPAHPRLTGASCGQTRLARGTSEPARRAQLARGRVLVRHARHAGERPPPARTWACTGGSDSYRIELSGIAVPAARKSI